MNIELNEKAHFVLSSKCCTCSMLSVKHWNAIDIYSFLIAQKFTGDFFSHADSHFKYSFCCINCNDKSEWYLFFFFSFDRLFDIASDGEYKLKERIYVFHSRFFFRSDQRKCWSIFFNYIRLSLRPLHIGRALAHYSKSHNSIRDV